ncbi:MAG: TonB-dependent receptor [Leptolyngbyaceae bacterium]|nr:TonB-dependent receptor [Leptolyngbyaceae bacterium]
MNQQQQSTWMVSVLLLLMTGPAWAEGEQGPEFRETGIRTLELEIKKEQNSETLKREVKGEIEVSLPSPIEQGVTKIVQGIAQITDVRLNPTADGVEIILETSAELATSTTVVGNTLIVNISNGVLALPSGEEFQAENPTEGIALVSITSQGDGIQVAITGSEAPPTAMTNPEAQNLVLNVTRGLVAAETAEIEEDADAIQVVVTGQQDRYSVPNATTATRTDTPLRDIPKSIQAVPRQVLEDRQVIRASDALRNVSGVQQGNKVGGSSEVFNIRGFPQFGGNLRDGFNNRNNFSIVETANLERIEVLKGPASVLYGNLDPGGVINFVTKQPLSEPFFAAGLQVGSFGLLRPTLDLSGPLNPERTLLYRLNTAYERGGNFRNFDTEVERFFISPVVTWKISDRTDLTFELEYVNDQRPYDRGLVAFGTGLADIPFDRVLGEPDDFSERTNLSTGYRLEHRFNDDWKIRNRFRYALSDQTSIALEPLRLNETTGVLGREFAQSKFTRRNYELQTDLVGNFATGSIQHTLLFGVDLSWQNDGGVSRFETAPRINIFNPVYGTAPRPSRDEFSDVFSSESQTNTLGFFLQDQITLAENLKLLVGGRFDTINQSSLSSERQDQAFSPRVGIVYQPIEPISLYTSFSRSFQPNNRTRANGSLLEPVRGTQYEVGVRGEFLNGRLTTNLAAYEITLNNLAVPDPDNPRFSLPSGEQRSRGIELDVTGQVLPGWNLIASYAYTDARVTKDNNLQPGNLLDGVPFNSASLWSTYEIQTGDFQGLGFGLGLFYVGERQGDLNNSFQVPSYARTDASIFYRRNNWRAGINVNNLFNVDYIEDSGQRRNRINPGAPFTVRGTVSVEF